MALYLLIDLLTYLLIYFYLLLHVRSKRRFHDRTIRLNSSDGMAGVHVIQRWWPFVYSGLYSQPYLTLCGIHRLSQCTVRALLCSSLTDVIAAYPAATANRNCSVSSPGLATQLDGEKERRKGDTTRRLAVRPPDVAMVKVRVTRKRRRDRCWQTTEYTYYFDCLFTR